MPIGPILSKMLVLVVLLLVGFLAAKLGLTNAEFNRRITPVLMNVFLIGTILNSVFSADVFVGGVVLLQYFASASASLSASASASASASVSASASASRGSHPGRCRSGKRIAASSG